MIANRNGRLPDLLSMHLKKSTFIATLLILSDVLAILGSLSRSFQTNASNLLSVEDLLRDQKAALESLQEYPCVVATL